jgi:sugar fermentation stimulation protein A
MDRKLLGLVQYPSPLIYARFLRRYQRFFSDMRLDDGTLVVAHCANSGSMKTCLVPEGAAWLSVHDDPKRKLKYTWEVAEVDNAQVFVHPVRANHLVREAIERSLIPELDGYDTLTAESRINDKTRFDFLLTRKTKKCYVEVKSATLALGNGRTAFPDAVSKRAVKHLQELVAMKKMGHQAALVFCASRTDASSVEPADDIDPDYGNALRWAIGEGVQALALGVEIRTDLSLPTVTLNRRIPVITHPGAHQVSLKPSGKR